MAIKENDFIDIITNMPDFEDMELTENEEGET